MTYSSRTNERGAISGLLVAVIALSVLVVGVGSFAIWAFVNYNDASSSVQDKIDIAVAQAREDKGTEDDTKFAEELKQPNKTYKAPDDYCGLSFQYPKTWSRYDSEQLTNGGDFKSYLNPDTIPAITGTQQFALRVLIEQKDYDTVVAQYAGLVKKGDLKQSSTTSQGNEGQRLTGNFDKNIRGDAVIYRCRDKTITIRTDADTFSKDFQAIVNTIDYNA